MDHLDRDRPLRADMGRFIDGAHAALTQSPADRILPVEGLAVWEAVEEGHGISHPWIGSSRDGDEPTFDTAMHTPTLTIMATTPAWRFHSWLWPLASSPA